MKYFSMFSGIGGFELGIKNAFYNTRNNKAKRELLAKGEGVCCDNSKGSGNNIQSDALVCCGFSEIDKYAIQIYEKHFKGHQNYGSATEIIPDLLPDFDLLVGGFPCQAFSIAGKRHGFSDTRGTLFFEIARVLREKQPRLCLLENVKGLLSHAKGETFFTILSTLDELGYDCQWQVLNSKNFGVPQNRERVFIVGHLRGTSRPEVFPIQNTTGSAERSVVSNTIDANYWKGIDNHGSRKAVASRQDTQPERNKPDSPNSIWRETYSDDMRIRRLTPTECERLQGFPDGWTEGISDTQRYKCLGNAVTVNVIEAIVKELSK